MVYCALHEQNIIGAAVAFPTMKNHFWMHKIFTVKEYRKAGVALRLMEKVLIHLQEIKAPCYLTVSPGNEAALRLYRRLGFREEGLIKGYYREFEDRYLLYREVD